MKKLIALIALVVLTTAAQAQSRTPLTLIDSSVSGGSVGNGATLSPTNMIVGVRLAEKIGVACSFQLDGAGTNSPTVKFAKSADGVTFETTPSITLAAVLLNGTTAVKTFDAVDVTGVHSIKLASIVNGVSGQAITNLSVKVFLKNLP